QLAKTGAGADPAFRWVGRRGYRSSSAKYAGEYVRARHYSLEGGIWTSTEPIPLLSPINKRSYASASPVTLTARTGNRPAWLRDCCWGADVEKYFNETIADACNHGLGKRERCENPGSLLDSCLKAFDPSKDCAQLLLDLVNRAGDCSTFCSGG